MEMWWYKDSCKATIKGDFFFVKKGPQVHNFIPKFMEWMIITCVVTRIGGFMPRFLYLRVRGLEVIALEIVEQGHAR